MAVITFFPPLALLWLCGWIRLQGDLVHGSNIPTKYV